MKMNKKNRLCPFSHGACEQCAIYRGRHIYLTVCKGSAGSSRSKDNGRIGGREPIDFASIKELFEPWANNKDALKSLPDIAIKVINAETNETRICTLTEAKEWDWSDTTEMRVVGDIQIYSWDKLVEIARFKAKKGARELVLYEAPRFMLLAGG
jgi:hypothetical protein